MKNTEHKFVLKPGSISLFPIHITNRSDHDFWGKIKTFSGLEKRIQTVIKNSATDKIFMVGYVFDDIRSFESASQVVDTKQPNTIILFKNTYHTPVDQLKDLENEKPYYVGFYVDETKERYEVSLWLKIGKISKNEYFSGIYKYASESPLTNSSLENIHNTSEN